MSKEGCFSSKRVRRSTTQQIYSTGVSDCTKRRVMTKYRLGELMDWRWCQNDRRPVAEYRTAAHGPLRCADSDLNRHEWRCCTSNNDGARPTPLVPGWNQFNAACEMAPWVVWIAGYMPAQTSNIGLCYLGCLLAITVNAKAGNSVFQQL